jgi:hypothetical protein
MPDRRERKKSPLVRAWKYAELPEKDKQKMPQSRTGEIIGAPPERTTRSESLRHQPNEEEHWQSEWNSSWYTGWDTVDLEKDWSTADWGNNATWVQWRKYLQYCKENAIEPTPQKGAGKGKSKGKKGKGPGSRAATPGPTGTDEDKVCRSWRAGRPCPRLASGQHCPFEHPAHVNTSAAQQKAPAQEGTQDPTASGAALPNAAAAFIVPQDGGFSPFSRFQRVGPSPCVDGYALIFADLRVGRTVMVVDMKHKQGVFLGGPLPFTKWSILTTRLGGSSRSWHLIAMLTTQLTLKPIIDSLLLFTQGCTRI